MSERDADPNTLLLLGEIKGQLRELIHTSNGNSAKPDALGSRVGKLENERSGREAQAGLLSALAKSPLVGWIIGGGAFVWGVLTGRIHL